jgi:sugar O-acyltransferase (sialic acid O-acetyltransferase NeuD family)
MLQPEGTRAAQPLLVFPCNGNALEALDCLAPHWKLQAFIDDTPLRQAECFQGHAVLGRAALRRWAEVPVLAVPGSSRSYRTRRALVDSLEVPADRWARVIHPRATVSPLARIGRNVLVMAGVVITSDAVIGDHVCVLPNTVIHHGASVGPWTLIGSGVTLAGDVQVGENCYLGSGTRVREGVRIGDGALTGMGSTVIRHVPAAARVAGTPTRMLS